MGSPVRKVWPPWDLGGGRAGAEENSRSWGFMGLEVQNGRANRGKAVSSFGINNEISLRNAELDRNEGGGGESDRL